MIIRLRLFDECPGLPVESKQAVKIKDLNQISRKQCNSIFLGFEFNLRNFIFLDLHPKINLAIITFLQ